MQSNFVDVLNFRFNFILIGKADYKTKKVSQVILRNLSPKPNYIYENYFFANSKNKLTSTSFATPAPVGSYLIL